MSGPQELFDRTPESPDKAVIQRWPADAREILKGQPDRFSLQPWPSEAAEPADFANEPPQDNEAPRRGRQRREAAS